MSLPLTDYIIVDCRTTINLTVHIIQNGMIQF